MSLQENEDINTVSKISSGIPMTYDARCELVARSKEAVSSHSKSCSLTTYKKYSEGSNTIKLLKSGKTSIEYLWPSVNYLEQTEDDFAP